MAVAGGAAGLITALNSNKTVKSTTNLLKTTQEVNKAQDNGAIDSFNNLLQGIQSGPVQGALKYFFAQLQAETVTSGINLMTALLEAFKSEGGKEGISALGSLINTIIDNSADIVSFVNTVNENTGAITAFFLGIKSMIDSFSSGEGPLETFKNLLQKISSATRDVNEPLFELSTFIENLAESIRKILSITVDVPFGTNDSEVPSDWTEPDPSRPGMQEF